MEEETRAAMKALRFPRSTIHISRPDEALRVHLSPAVSNLSWPPPLTVPSQNKLGEPYDLLERDGFFSLCTQLVVSAINRHLQAITGVVLWAAVWPDGWPRCDCSLG